MAVEEVVAVEAAGAEMLVAEARLAVEERVSEEADMPVPAAGLSVLVADFAEMAGSTHRP